jgi:hypothetical protein
MAQVTTPQAVDDLFEWGFPITTDDWESLPEMAAEWPTWDIESRMDFLTDWPVVEERTQRLLDLERTLPTGDKRRVKLRRLRATVDRNRSVLEWLAANVAAK